MSIQFGNAVPPHLSHPEFFFTGVFIGLAAILLLTYLVDTLGTAMFHRGFAKPFYIKGKRIHHRVIYLILPTAYGLFVAFYFLGYILVPWHSFWDRLSTVGILSACTLAIDFLGDRFWPRIRKNVILHHEWLYALIPAAVFTYLVTIVV
jgi:hypothetical protein